MREDRNWNPEREARRLHGGEEEMELKVGSVMD